jgi:eukaryotic-like serine/threonine-protein kinase
MSDDAPEVLPTVAEELPAEARPPRRFGVPALVILVVVAFLAVGIGLGAWMSLRSKVSVPDVIGLPAPIAVEQILGAQLATATMGTIATSNYDSGLVVRQSPTATGLVPIGTPVDLLVAVSPTTTVTPNVVLDTIPGAGVKLGYALLRPVVFQQLSQSVPYGRVVSQMPRAGQAITTGQQVALFVSIGPGTGGAAVPSVLGKTLDAAAASITGVYLVPVLLNEGPDTNPQDTVTDQVPAPGTRIPIGSAVPLITSGSAN